MILGDGSEFDMAKFMPKESKFAELIVRECMEVANIASADLIKEYFGVEE
jgi:hypothetical protein